MHSQLLSFTGGRVFLNEAIIVAQSRLVQWMWLTGVQSSSIRLMTTDTQAHVYAEQGLVWHHTITVLVECERDPDPDFKAHLRIAEAYRSIQQHPLPTTPMTIPMLEQSIPEPPPAVASRRKGLPPRTEREERALIEQNNIRCQRMGAYGELTYGQWKALCDLFGNICLSCKASTRLTIDHVVPVPEGTNLIGNIQPLCRSCNSSKGGNYTDYRDPSDLGAFLQLIADEK